ncbi:MAG: DNA mismatch repair protein MutS [Planctomycetes bacterium]|nr:DNA mismatch repair protein MutS [Planctomycetota bacterium]MBI3845621.1 DNA mismatch repair protein MutS [Planctomycetota bacterium]
MMEQYLSVKKAHPDTLLFFHMGDFYELFFDDAKVASKALGIALTARQKGENAIPMAGVPVRSVHHYLRRLIRGGFRVAICDQVQDPKDADGLVERAVTRIVTAGTITDDAILEGKENNFLAAVRPSGSTVGLAWVDLSTGAFFVEDVARDRLADAFSRLAPAEVLAPDDAVRGDADLSALLRDGQTGVVSPRPDWTFDRELACRSLGEHFGIASLEGFGVEDVGPALGAAGAVLAYLRDTQRGALAHIRKIEAYRSSLFMTIDRATQRALELVNAGRDGGREGTLLDVLDHTATAMGARLLRTWILAPLLDVEAIRGRQSAVREIGEDADMRTSIGVELLEIADLERIAARVGTGRASPRDLAALRDSLVRVPAIRAALDRCRSAELGRLLELADPIEDLASLLTRSLEDAPALALKEGGIIRTGFDAELDELHAIGARGKDWMAALQAREVERTGISSLKVGYNAVFGYYIEIGRSQTKSLPADYSRKQTLKNVERYVTPDLRAEESKVLHAADRAREREYELFLKLRDETAARLGRVQSLAAALATIDALASLATVATSSRWVFPDVHDDLEIDVRDGRHPVVERALPAESFVPNDLVLDGTASRVLVITGPNMAGKSTYIRQAALLVLLAQIGSAVPARAAKIGVVDRVFARVGAQDELFRGKSTFLVEMMETANILNNATSRSLVILDEIGRGTSTFDGVSIAWAVTEHLHKIVRARTLFATHYHQLTDLAELYPGIGNRNVLVQESGDEIAFLHRIVEGGTDRSYGIHVARLAGVPREVIVRAEELLAELDQEAEGLSRRLRALAGPSAPEDGNPAPSPVQLSLFRPIPLDDSVVRALRAIDPERMTPLEALTKIAELKKMAARK